MPKPLSSEELDGLLPFANEFQTLVIEAVKSEGSYRKAAAKIGRGDTTIVNVIRAVRTKASQRGLSPEHDWHHPVPDTHIARGVSTFYNLETGQPTRQWVKADLDREKREALIREALEGFKSEIPRAKAQAKRKGPTLPELCNLFTITDFHLAMKSWHEETGDDWDMAIAEDLLIAWFEMAISQAPDAEQAVFAQLADFLHFDSLEAVTPTSRHVLDADTRHQKMVRVALRVLRRCVALLLAKHERVHIIMAEGNHDPAGSAWLREAFAIFYEDEPRVTVDTSPDPYYGFQWGKTALFFHHGHKRKVTNIADVFAAKFRQMFGETEHAYAHMGHLHHKHVLETNLMIVEQHRTLAAKDAYASSGGWMAGRDAQVITYSKAFGEVGRVAVSPDMVRAA